MTIAFQCSGCDNQFRVADTMAGRKGKCPKCGTINLIPDSSEPAPRSAPPPPRTASGNRSAAVKRSPEAVRPAPPPLPRSRKAARKDEFDFEDDDVREDVDRDEEEERPSRRRKKKKGFPFLFVGLGCGLGLLLLFGVGGAAWYFWPSGIGDDLRYMPNGCQMIASVRLDQMLDSEAVKQVKREFPDLEKKVLDKDLEKEVGLGPTNIERVTFGANFSGQEPDIVAVVHTKTSVQASDLTAKMRRGKDVKESKVGSYTIYESSGPAGDAFCIVNSKLVVGGPSKSVRAVLQRDKKPDFSASMQAAMNQVNFSDTYALALDVKSLPKDGGNAGLMPGGLGNFSATKMIGGVDGFALSGKVATDVTLKATVLCKDNQSATDLKKQIDGALVTVRQSEFVPKDFANLLDMDLTVSGSNLNLTKTIKVEPLLKAARDARPKAHNIGGPPDFPNQPPQQPVVPPKGRPNGGFPKKR
jgi:phage FluMu protein Com